jgi:hypothetical protein
MIVANRGGSEAHGLFDNRESATAIEVFMSSGVAKPTLPISYDQTLLGVNREDPQCLGPEKLSSHEVVT